MVTHLFVTQLFSSCCLFLFITHATERQFFLLMIRSIKNCTMNAWKYFRWSLETRKEVKIRSWLTSFSFSFQWGTEKLKQCNSATQFIHEQLAPAWSQILALASATWGWWCHKESKTLFQKKKVAFTHGLLLWLKLYQFKLWTLNWVSLTYGTGNTIFNDIYPLPCLT